MTWNPWRKPGYPPPLSTPWVHVNWKPLINMTDRPLGFCRSLKQHWFAWNTSYSYLHILSRNVVGLEMLHQVHLDFLPKKKDETIIWWKTVNHYTVKHSEILLFLDFIPSSLLEFTIIMSEICGELSLGLYWILVNPS